MNNASISRASYDAVVIGGGVTGLSSAISIAKGGRSVLVLDSDVQLHCASMRSAGQILPGFGPSIQNLHRKIEKSKISDLWRITIDALVNLQSQLGVRMNGYFIGAESVREFDQLKREVDFHRSIGYCSETIIPKDDVKQFVKSKKYVGGVHDENGFGIDPVGLMQILRSKAQCLNVEFLSDAHVYYVNRSPLFVEAIGRKFFGKTLVFAADRRLVFGNHIFAKNCFRLYSCLARIEVHDYDISSLIPSRCLINGSRFNLDYFNKFDDRRITFGSGCFCSCLSQEQSQKYLSRCFTRIFPEVRNISFSAVRCSDFGVVASGFPEIGYDGPIYHAYGYSGQGMLLGMIAGNAIGRHICNQPNHLDNLADLKNVRKFAFVGPAAASRFAVLAGQVSDLISSTGNVFR